MRFRIVVLRSCPVGNTSRIEHTRVFALALDPDLVRSFEQQSLHDRSLSYPRSLSQLAVGERAINLYGIIQVLPLAKLTPRVRRRLGFPRLARQR